MWNWFNCYLSGRHEYGVWCKPGVIFLRCVHCGRRSSGWAIDAKANRSSPVTHPSVSGVSNAAMTTAGTPPRVLPFNRSVAS